MIRPSFVLAAALFAAGAQAQEPKALRVYFVGNSVTDTINYRGLADLAKSRGYKQIWGRHMIPGAPLQWIWQHPKEGFEEPPFGHYPNALGNFQWDILSLQPFDRHIEGTEGDLAMAKNYIDLALPKSPNLHVYVYARWPRRGKDDFATAWAKKYTGGWDGTNETKDYFERLTGELRKAYPKLKIDLVPVGHVMAELDRRMQAGEAPGHKKIDDVFVDGIHLNNVGSYVVGCTFFATLYRENPRGLSGEPYKITDPKLVEVIQDTVWKVVNSNPWAGVAPAASQTSARPRKIWNRDGALGEIPKRTTEAFPLSDQENKGDWTKCDSLSDEFEGQDLDPRKWTRGLGWWKGRPPALFSDKNVTVSDGKLHLTMRKEKLAAEEEKQGYKDYTSACLYSKVRAHYGYYEVKAKPMNSAGSSSFWFQVEDTPGWLTEIDVFEIGGKAKNYEHKYNMNLHVFKTPQEEKHWSVGGEWIAPWRLADDYHVYGLAWGPEEIQYFVDGALVRSVENTHWRQPLYMIFDSETMPDWFGMPADQDLPSTFSIEYVRAWKSR